MKNAPSIKPIPISQTSSYVCKFSHGEHRCASWCWYSPLDTQPQRNCNCNIELACSLLLPTQAYSNSHFYIVRLVWFPGHMDWEHRKHSLGNTGANSKRVASFPGSPGTWISFLHKHDGAWEPGNKAKTQTFTKRDLHKFCVSLVRIGKSLHSHFKVQLA